MLLLCLLDKFYFGNSFVDGYLQVIKVYWLCSKVKGTIVHGSADVVHLTVGTHHNDFQRRIMTVVNLLQQCETIHFRHVDIAEYNVDIRMLQHHLQSFNAIVCKEKLILSFADFSAEILS